MKKVLLIDGYNMLYRSRSGYKVGDNPIIYTFFRSLRALVGRFEPDIVYFVLEGIPKKRLALSPEYKAQRTYHDDDGFYRQRTKIIEMLSQSFPIRVVRHDDYECDDVLANIVYHTHSSDDCIVVSSDTDFIQLYNQHPTVQLYNPIRKAFVSRPGYDYVTWKSLKGDNADNIAGFSGIGDKRAEKLVRNPENLIAFLSESPERKEKFQLNHELIRFHDMSDQMTEVQFLGPVSFIWEDVKTQFEEMDFKSITKDPAWTKFSGTFANLS